MIASPFGLAGCQPFCEQMDKARANGDIGDQQAALEAVRRRSPRGSTIRATPGSGPVEIAESLLMQAVSTTLSNSHRERRREVLEGFAGPLASRSIVLYPIWNGILRSCVEAHRADLLGDLRVLAPMLLWRPTSRGTHMMPSRMCAGEASATCVTDALAKPANRVDASPAIG
jgi:hypothetical protein